MGLSLTHPFMPEVMVTQSACAREADIECDQEEMKTQVAQPGLGEQLLNPVASWKRNRQRPEAERPECQSKRWTQRGGSGLTGTRYACWDESKQKSDARACGQVAAKNFFTYIQNTKVIVFQPHFGSDFFQNISFFHSLTSTFEKTLFSVSCRCVVLLWFVQG